MKRKIVWPIIIAWMVAPPVQGQELNTQVLIQITETAHSICGKFDSTGYEWTSSVEGTVDAELAKLFKWLANFGVQGGGEIKYSEYNHVLREDLGREFDSTRACNLKIWRDLVGFATVGSAPQSPPSCGDAATEALLSGQVIIFKLEEPSNIEHILAGKTYSIRYDAVSKTWYSKGWIERDKKVREVPYMASDGFGPPDGSSFVLLSHIIIYNNKGIVSRGIERHGNIISSIEGKLGLEVDPQKICFN